MTTMSEDMRMPLLGTPIISGDVLVDVDADENGVRLLVIRTRWVKTGKRNWNIGNGVLTVSEEQKPQE